MKTKEMNMNNKGRAKRRFAAVLALAIALQCNIFTVSAFAAEDPALDTPENPVEVSYMEEEAETNIESADSEYEVVVEEEEVAPVEEEAIVEENVEIEAAPVEEEVVVEEAVEIEAAEAVIEEQPEEVKAEVKSEEAAKVEVKAAEDKAESVVPPMEANQKMLTGVRLGDGKNGNGDGKYYCLDYTDTFKAIDSRYIPFETKLNASQYEAEDYDFTDQLLNYKGETYAYRPNGPQAGDGKDFHYYTISFMKVDKLAKSTYAGGYLNEGGHPSSWKLVTDLKKDADTGLWKDGYYHRDYQATLHVGDAPDAYDVVEEPVVEEPVIEEPTIEEPAIEQPVVEEPTIEEPAIEEPVVEEPTVEEPVIEQPAEEPIVEEPVIEEPVVEEPIIEEIVEEIEEIVAPADEEQTPVQAAEDTQDEQVADMQDEQIADEQDEQIANDDEDKTPVIPATTENNDDNNNGPQAPVANDVNDEIVTIAQQEAPQAEVATIEMNEAPQAEAVTIEMNEAPLAAAEGSWALMNLVLAGMSAILSLIAGVIRSNKRRALAIAVAAIAVIAFALTQNMGLSMVLADKWTILMAVLAAADIALIAAPKKSEDDMEAEPVLA